MVYTGTGSDVISIKPPESAFYFIHVEGNAAGKHFAVRAYDQNGDYLGRILSATSPYSGTRFLDLWDDQHTAMLEVEAEGPWTIEIQPFSVSAATERWLVDGVERSGAGDQALILPTPTTGATVLQATHRGTSNFSVRAYIVRGAIGDTSRLAINEIGDYDGKAVLPAGTLCLEVLSEGEWTISVE